MFSAYFVFHCFNMFCVEKQVLEFFVTHSQLAKIFATQLATHQSWNPSREFVQKLLWLAKIFATRFVTSPVVKRIETAF